MKGKSVPKKKGKKDETKQLREQLARALADYDNFRKRVEREREQLELLVSAKFVLKILPVFDMLEEAQKHLKDSGVALTIEEFEKVFKEEGIEKIEVKTGDRFNEELHEAVEAVKAKGKDGRVTEAVLSGWKLVDGPVIRPVKVKVGKK